MTSAILPDVNLWLALSVGRHEHHAVVRDWFESLPSGTRLWFCRMTQMGLLRLLSQEAVMGRGALSQAAAWKIYDRLAGDDLVRFMPEPLELEAHFRQAASAASPMPRRWSDDYLIAFAAAAGLRLATLDRGLSRRVAGALLLA